MAETPASTLRLFLALWPDEVARSRLALWRDAWSWPNGSSPTRTERLHMTLHFIGPVPADRVPSLCDALALDCEPFTLSFGVPELWAHGLAVVCPDGAPLALARLHADLANALRRLSLPVEERPFRPHVTLGRRAGRASPPADGPRVEWHVSDGFALVQSLPGGQGYRLLQRFN